MGDMNISPAVNFNEKISSMSADEFQKQLCIWLEDKGLLCELRTYFRTNMIEILKNTALGNSISTRVRSPMSPKLQSINLLVSEFLLYSQYHFSLCVFCTEVSLINVFPELTNDRNVNTHTDKMWKFSKNDVNNILESLGIVPSSEIAQYISSKYYETNEECLLSCILWVSLHFKVKVLDSEVCCNEKVCDKNYKMAIKNINRILMNSNITSEELSQVRYYIKVMHDIQNKTILKMENDTKLEYKNQLNKHKAKLNDIQKCFELERQTLKQELSDVKLYLQEKKSVKGNANQIKPQDEKLCCDTENIETRIKNSVKGKENQIKPQEEKLHGDTENIENRIKNKLDLKNIPKNLKIDVQEQLTVENECHSEDNENKAKVFINPNLENKLLKNLISKLQQENGALQKQNGNYIEKIDKLAHRAEVLMNELENSQQKLVRLNGYIQNSEHNSRPFLTRPVTVDSMRRRGIVSYDGAGEEILHMTPVVPKAYRNLFRENRSHSYPKHSIRSPNSSDDSPTDDILQEARSKLRNLELESTKINKNFMYSSGHRSKLGSIFFGGAENIEHDGIEENMHNNFNNIRQSDEFQFVGPSNYFTFGNAGTSSCNEQMQNKARDVVEHNLHSHEPTTTNGPHLDNSNTKGDIVNLTENQTNQFDNQDLHSMKSAFVSLPGFRVIPVPGSCIGINNEEVGSETYFKYCISK